MSDTKPKNNEAKSKVIKKIIDITLALAIVGGAIYGVKTITSDFSDINRTTDGIESEIIESSTDNVPSEGKVIYVSELKDNQEIHTGSLIVVNGNTEYKGEEGNLISMYDMLQNDGTKDYTVMSSDVKLKVEAATALNDMLKNFAKETGKNDIIVDGGYRSVAFQQELYDAAEDKSTAAEPGFSDYHTGYSIDFSINAGDDAIEDFTGEGEYSWFEKNSYKYGYVLRFPEGKKDKTGYDYRPWHYRYVGRAHAYYMHKNGLSLEEYTEKMKSYDYTKTHLIFSDDSGQEYEAYYCPIDAASSTTVLAIPDSDYQISGNNTDGFIIIFRINSVEQSATEQSTEDTVAAKTTEQSEPTDETYTVQDDEQPEE